jgi:hypothetical protein
VRALREEAAGLRASLASAMGVLGRVPAEHRRRAVHGA